MTELAQYLGIASLVVGLAFILFPTPIAAASCRILKSIWERHQDDTAGKVNQEMRSILPGFVPDYDEARTPRAFRFFGIVLLIQAAVFFVLWAVL